MIKIISIHKSEPYRSFVLNGQKTIEERLNRGKWTQLKKGDILKMRPGNFKFVIKDIRGYKTFAEMFKNEGLKNVLPDQIDIKDGVKIYHKYYSAENEKKFGVLAIEIKK